MNAWMDEQGWFSVNDGVMGGVSQGAMQLDDRNGMVFCGEISFVNRGGFASVRHAAEHLGLSEAEGIKIRVRGDGRTYQLRVRTALGVDDIAYTVSFETKKDVWESFTFPWNAFCATYHGREVPSAPPLCAKHIHVLGFLIADHIEGPFSLYVNAIEPDCI